MTSPPKPRRPRPPPGPDPIAELERALARDGKPTLEWVTRWSAGGAREPVAAAWAKARFHDSMVKILERGGRKAEADLLIQLVLERKLFRTGRGVGTDRDLVPALRRLTPPALVDLLAAPRGGRGAPNAVPAAAPPKRSPGT